MRKLLYILSLYSLSLVFSSAEDESNLSVQRRIAPKLIQLIAEAPEVELLSLEPTIKLGKDGHRIGPPDGSIDGHLIIRRTTIKSRDEISALAGALGAGIIKSDGKTQICFDPMHALRMIRKEGDVVVVVSFQCLQGYVKGFTALPSFSTTSAPEKEWNAIFEKHGLPRPN